VHLTRRVFCGALAAAAIVTIVVLGSASARAEDGKLTFLTLGKQSGFLELGSGAFALIGNEQKGRGRPTGEVNLDAVSGWDLVNFWDLMRVSPTIGGFLTARGGIMGYAGLHGAIPIGDRVELDPFTTLGAYGDGNGRDMGSKALFHVGLTGYYLFETGYRAGLTFAHESNAGLFPRDREHCTCNPSANDVLMTVGLPIDKLGF